MNKERILQQLSTLDSNIDNEFFYVDYQPIYENDKGIIATEALIRAKDKSYSILELIDTAKKSQLIDKLTLFVLTDACSLLKQTKDLKFISINISPIQCSEELIIDIIDTIDVNDIQPSFINLENTEDEEPIVASLSCFMNKLADLGIMFHMDDFGTGFANINYLKDGILPYHYIKYDISLISQIAEINSNGHIILEKLTKAFQECGFRIIAEGVETPQQFYLLSKKMKIDLFQGYYFSKPLHKVELKELVKNH
ncbi:EAL domain-containing protein [[Clostridium] innocuum]|uniref:EAL domain-containing protein n=1 Tax=Clostridium innocuum TaxID=1522 RepID=UPI000D6CAC60|nr:EAL domain-containing protein [[Clostridium] innocuum]MCR0315827.1 EAL domain-containing protein [[Clostridium] innocuum]MCR0370971.1 EAL domain-containing protein [[Clostridium] innocuum]MCR0375574.1 EAL domain-containing protein [[Clostridium] innocuum]MCR0560948.1 EAL domain-containing protein [[Clostridium] innocuum]MCR0603722.1 EAL domain-containing protein [[Clostridium] innocuum]